MLSLSVKQHQRGSMALVFMSAVPIVFGLALTLATFVLVVVVAYFNSWDHFYLLFSKVSKV